MGLDIGPQAQVTKKTVENLKLFMEQPIGVLKWRNCSRQAVTDTVIKINLKQLTFVGWFGGGC